MYVYMYMYALSAYKYQVMFYITCWGYNIVENKRDLQVVLLTLLSFF